MKLLQVGIKDRSFSTLYQKCFLAADQEVIDTKQFFNKLAI